MSNQVVRTPRPFLDAVEKRFGPITFDLAATRDNSVAGSPGAYFGPDSVFGEDSLKAHWPLSPGLKWLNPPFSDKAQPMVEWVRKCAAFQRRGGGPVALLVPAAVCTVWFREHVGSCAYVFELFPRVFSKEIRDCALALYTPERYRGREPWNWNG